jgi:hypothetical protein
MPTQDTKTAADLVMKTPNQLRTLSISVSLVILALGFLSFVKTQPAYTSSIFPVEHAYSLIGSTFSVLVGATFLVAAITFRGARTGSEMLVARIDANLTKAREHNRLKPLAW